MADKTNPHKRRAFIEKCRAAGVDRGVLLAVSLEEFFDGNDDPGSLCCNITDHPAMPALYGALDAIRRRDDVQDVLVVVREIIDENTWPFSSDVYVITTLGLEDAADMVHAHLPEEAWPDSIDQPSGPAPVGLPMPERSAHVFDLWWD